MSTRISLPVVSVTATVVLMAAIIWYDGSADVLSGVESATKVQLTDAIPSAAPSSSTAIERILAGELPELTDEQIADYVEKENHSAVSLVAAWQLSGDDLWLEDAAEDHPDDPQVALAMLLKQGIGSHSAAWIDSLKRNEPGNALGPLYAAKVALDEGDPELALIELATLPSESAVDLHTTDWTSAMTDAYHSAGHRGPEADLASFSKVPLPLGGLVDLGNSLGMAIHTAKESGDQQTAETLGQLGFKAANALARHGESELLITQLTSNVMERRMLNELFVFDFIPGDQKLVVERLEEMDKTRSRIKSAITQFSELMPTMTDSQLKQYTRRIQTTGELKAMEWLVAQKPSS